MNASEKSAPLFLLGCIPARIALAYVAKTHVQWLSWLSVLGLIIGCGFFAIYLTDSRKVGAETFGKPIWWNSLRPIHGFLYLSFAIAAARKSYDAWMFLAVDVVIGILAFVSHRLL